jgi:hypothetical protein
MKFAKGEPELTELLKRENVSTKTIMEAQRILLDAGMYRNKQNIGHYVALFTLALGAKSVVFDTLQAEPNPINAAVALCYVFGMVGLLGHIGKTYDKKAQFRGRYDESMRLEDEVGA